MSLRPTIARWLPAGLKAQLRGLQTRLRGGVFFEGDYEDWKSAQKVTSGYDAAEVLLKTRDSIRSIRDGKAIFERDSVLLPQAEYPFPLITCLLDAVVRMQKQSLSILDYGGSLGSSYFSCRRFLQGLSRLNWSVVEQAHYVDCGRREFQTGELSFYYSIDECLSEQRPDVLLMSCVLPYLESPYALLAEAFTKNFEYLLIDRHPTTDLDHDVLTVQHVPKTIYGASYPAWFFSSEIFRSFVGRDYELLFEFPALGGRAYFGNHFADYNGFFFARKKQPKAIQPLGS